MKHRISLKIQEIIQETEQELQNLYSTRFKELILFGSFARGDFTEDSDIDLLLLLENMKDIVSESFFLTGLTGC